MSTAEELLTSAHIHTHPVPDTDVYFIIDPITRKIENPNRMKSTIMQYDHNSERFTFQLPRYVDGHDMLECTSVTVNVDNIESETGTTCSDAPDMTDLRLNPDDPETVISSWSITRNLTQFAGILSFSIEYKCVDSDGNVVYEWSTDTYDEIEVKARKKNGEAAVIEHTDLLEQWRTKIFGAGDSVMANIAAEGEEQVAAVKMESETQQAAVELKGAQTLETIPEDYTEVDAMADEAVRSKGDAIVCEASGGSIVINDSSDDHIRGMKLFGKTTQKTTTGKNLLAIKSPSGSSGGITYTVQEDGGIHVKGTSTSNTWFTASGYKFGDENLVNVPAGTYWLSGNPVTNLAGYINGYYPDGTAIPQFNDVGNGTLVTLSQDAYIYYQIMVGPNVTVDAVLYPQLEVGTAATAYEPYTGGKPAPNPDYPQELVSIENLTVNICGKNLLRNALETQTINGLTFTVNADKSVTVNGTCTSLTKVYFEIPSRLMPGTNYILSGCPAGGATQAYALWVNGSGTHTDNGESATFTYRTDLDLKPCIRISEGCVANDLKFYPMIRLASDADTTYEPYAGGLLPITHSILGIPVTSGGNYTDSNGQQWICDEVDLERGVYVQRIRELVLDGDENPQNDWYPSIVVNVLSNALVKPHVDLLCNYFGNVYCGNSYGTTLAFGDMDKHGIESADAFNDFVIEKYAEGNPVTVMYALLNPIKTPLTAEELTAFKALRTNHLNTTILNDAGAWMSVKYNADTKTYVENPKVLKLVDSSTGVVYELKIVDGALTVVPV